MAKDSQKNIFPIIVGGIFLFLDQLLKYLSLHAWKKPVLINDWLGWSPFLNYGVAFGLPINNLITICFSIPLIGLIFYLAVKERKKTINFYAWALILTGALSNFIDRLAHGYVVDYFLILTGLINLGDVLIVGGLLLYLYSNFYQKKK